MDKQQIQKLIEKEFDSLPRVLQQAARFVVSNPTDVALDSMRGVARKAGVQPAAMLRLARQLRFENYEVFREHFRSWLADRDSPLTDRAKALRRGPHGDSNAELVSLWLEAESRNLSQTLGAERHASIAQALLLLQGAERIYVMGLRSLFSAAFYFNYTCSMFMGNVTMLTSIGGTFADELRRINDRDVLLVFSYHPYTQDSLRAMTFATQRGAKIITVTDSPVAPTAPIASCVLLAPNTTPSLLPSVLPALAISQTLAALLVANSADASMQEIANSEAQLRHFNVYLKDH
ncbi:MurR/RpiR family transcriptional regulator [Pseudomonas fulva]|nr:MurR/RpiR family transcriptional regulator [Pseudomonas fulva]MBF8781251.1 MurR/RpiR family transcriptional regulator [Pseudomonas fulva]